MLSKAIPGTKDLHDIPEPVLERIRRILRSLTGVHLKGYKDACIKRRLAVRIRAAGYSSAEDYADFLLCDKSESAALIKTLTIHVSRFFRNPATFRKIRDEILPSLFSLCLSQGRDSLTIRSIGCASGEEPYSLALILHDSFAEEMARVRVSICGMDIDADVLRIAAGGVYDPESLEEVPPSIRKRYFALCEGKYHLLPEIRDMVVFHRENLLTPAVHSPSDLIMCRNVLIYFDRDIQESIVRGFAGNLFSGGVLVLGKAETMMGEARRLFRTECAVDRIYRKL